MSEYLHQKGYIYPLGKLSDEENNSIYKKIKGEENFDLDKDKFELEYMGKNDYLIWLTYSTYGEKSDEFGSSRYCNQQEIYYHAPKFRDILGEIDTKKLKFIDYCYYNSTECTVDYYLGEEEYKPMTLDEAIQHCKDFANIQHTFNKEEQRKCREEHGQLAEWLTKLQGYEDETPITDEWLNEKFWFDTECEYWDFDTDVNPVEIREIRKNHFYSIFVPHFNYKINVRTRGQLRCFLAACGFGDSVKQLKS